MDVSGEVFLKSYRFNIYFSLLLFAFLSSCGKGGGHAPASIVESGSISFSIGSSYDFGATQAGQIVQATISVTHEGGPVGVSPTIASPFRFKGGAYPGVGGTCASTITSNCSLVLNFEPTAAGNFSGNLNLSYTVGSSLLSVVLGLTGSATLPPPTDLLITGSNSVQTGQCVPFVLNSVVLPNINSPVAGNTTVNLNVNSGTGTYYSDIGCSIAVTSRVITAGQSSATVYFRSNTAPQTPTLVASASGLQSGTKVISVASAPTKLSILAPSQIQINDCRQVTISRLDNSNIPVASLSSTNINLATTGSALVYSDNSCGSAITSSVIGSGSSSVSVYVRNSVAQQFDFTASDQAASLSADTATINSVNTLNWWNTSYAKRIQITLDNSDQAVSFNNQAVLIRLNSGVAGYANFNADGSDLRFVADDHTTQLDHEIERWDVNGNSYVWVKIPNLPSAAAQTIFLYFGNTSASSSENASSLWTRYSSVWHLKESPAATAPQFLDSSASAKHGTATNNPTSVSGIIGNALGLNGNYDSIDVGSLNSTLGATSTLSFWINTSQVGSNTNYQAPGITGIEVNGGTNDIFWGWLDATGFIGVTAGDGVGAKSNLAINDNVWRHITISRNGANGAVRFYVNGVLNSSGTSGVGTISTTFSKFGVIPTSTGGAGYEFDGSLDEIRIINSVLTDDEVRADFKFQNNSNVNFGTLESY